MMKNRFRGCLQCSLKIFNSILMTVGVAMTLYSLWMLKKWYLQKHTILLTHGMGVSSTSPLELMWRLMWLLAANVELLQVVEKNIGQKRFIYTFLSMGIILCFITFSGHIAAETANSLFLSIHILFVCLLLLLQAGFAAYILLKKDWESDIPEDPTGQLDQLKDFLRTNFDICKFIGLFVLVVQALNVFLALILCASGSELARDHDSENDFIPLRSDLKQSFLIRPDSQPTVNPEPQLGQNNYGIGVSEFLNNQVD